MTKKKITVQKFVDDLIARIDNDVKTIDCCKPEIRLLAQMAKERMGDQLIEVEWKD